MERKDILALASDMVKGKVAGNFSTAEAAETLRSALIEMNGGSTKLNYKNFHRGNELFALVEELIPVIIEESLNESNPIFDLVEYKNIKEGDENAFVTEGDATFIVADAANGVKGVRRQRISDGETVTVKTNVKIVRLYEDLSRVLAGRVDFNKFIDGVAKSFNKQILTDAYKAISEISTETAGLNSEYVVSGTFDEDSLLDLVEHVEAATGKTARIIGTKSALRKVNTAIVSDEAKSDLYNVGYYGKFNGTDMICLNQAHKADGKTFVLNNSQIFVVASDDKPIKMVNEGEGILIQGDATNNNDLTQEYVYGQSYGVGVICANKIGVYNIG